MLSIWIPDQHTENHHGLCVHSTFWLQSNWASCPGSCTLILTVTLRQKRRCLCKCLLYEWGSWITGSGNERFPGQGFFLLTFWSSDWLPGTAQLHQAGHGSPICALHGLQKDLVHQLLRVLPTKIGKNYFLFNKHTCIPMWHSFSLSNLAYMFLLITMKNVFEI